MKKSETGVATVETKALVKKNVLLEGVKDEVASTLIETVLPKIKPFIKPAVDKIQEFLGDNENFVIIRRLNNKVSAQVIVFDNSKKYEISNGVESFDKDGNKINADKKKIFKAIDNDAVVNVFNVEEFINALLKGEFKGK